MAIVDAKQFDGTLGGAKAVAAWVGDETKCVYGATWGHTDEKPGGLNLISEVDGAPFYTDVWPTQWVVKTDDGQLMVFTDAQMSAVTPAG